MSVGLCSKCGLRRLINPNGICFECFFFKEAYDAKILDLIHKDDKGVSDT